MNDWTEYQWPAPQFERVVTEPDPGRAELPDLDAMARKLDEMKVEASIDAERTRPALNGFLTFIVVAGLTYLAQFVMRFGTGAFAELIHTQPLEAPTKAIIAGGAGVVAAAAVTFGSQRAARRTQKAVTAFEEQLISLGGVPLPERGLAAGGKKRRAW